MSASPSPLDVALAYHREGRLAEAEHAYRQILAADPNNSAAWHFLGVVAHQVGRHEAAVDLIRRGITLDPGNPLAHSNLGEALRALGRLEEAMASYRWALELQPSMADAWYNLGSAQQQRRELERAAESYRQAIRLQPQHVLAYNNLGIVLRDLKRLEEAVAAYRRAIELDPNYADAWNNLGVARRDAGQLVEAESCYLAALRLNPDFYEAFSNLGTLWTDQGKLSEAEDALRRSLRIQPRCAITWNHLGNVLKLEGRLDEALAAYRDALGIDPNLIEAHGNRGVVLWEQRQFAEAYASFQRALQLDPNQASTHHNLALYWQQQGDMEQARASLGRAIDCESTPARRVQAATLLPVVYESPSDVDSWRNRIRENLASLDRDGVRLDPAHDEVPPLFHLAYQGRNDRSLQEAFSSLFTERPTELPRRDRRNDGRIQIGFISRHFCEHTVGKMMLGFIQRLPRDAFAVTVVSLGRHADSLALAIRAAADQYVEGPLQVAGALALLRQIPLDVLFYADLGMDGLNYSLAHLRLAPVQCVTWGHPVTTGIKTIDYFISSSLLEVEHAQEHYSEQLVRLDTMPTYCYRPRLPAPAKTRSQLGLPQNAHLYTCPQSLFKFHPDFDPLLAGVLRDDSQGRLVVFSGQQTQWNELLRARFRRTFGDVAERVLFLPRLDFGDFCGVLESCDVMLDTLHFTGGQTTLDGLAMGLPIVTLPGEFMRGRQTLGWYRKLGLLDCVAQNAEQYVQIALRLGKDAEYRQHISRQIVEKSDLLFEDQRAVDELAAFLQSVG